METAWRRELSREAASSGRVGGSGGSEPVSRVQGPVAEHSAEALWVSLRAPLSAGQRPLMSKRAYEPTQPLLDLGQSRGLQARGASRAGLPRRLSLRPSPWGECVAPFLGLVSTGRRASGPPRPALRTAPPLALGREWGGRVQGWRSAVPSCCPG